MIWYDGRIDIHSVKSAWQILNLELKARILSHLEENNKRRKTNTHTHTHTHTQRERERQTHTQTNTRRLDFVEQCSRD